MTIGDISDPQIEKDRRCVARLVIHDRDVGFVGGWPSSGVHENELANLTMQGFSSRTTTPPRTSE
jgi:hypothetical protein